MRSDDRPAWQRRGSGLSWEEIERPGENPITGERVVARRRCIRHDLDLPVRDKYTAILGDLMARN